MASLITTLGPKRADELGILLPHEHVFVDLRTWDKPGYARAETEDVIRLMQPELEKARQAGITAIVECSPVGVGRRSDILKAVSLCSGYPLVVPTGVYREPWIPPWVHQASEESLFTWMESELTGQIVENYDGNPQESGVQAGFIKLSAGDDGLTACETRVLRGAARAGAKTNAAIGSHTIRGRVAREQLNIIEDCGFSPQRFIWIHAQAEPDFNLNLEMAQRGAWIEYDSIGSREEDDRILERVLRMVEAGWSGRLLLSQDRGWYDPAQPGGGTPRPFDYLVNEFLPRLRQAGMDEAGIRQLTVINPFQAFAR